MSNFLVSSRVNSSVDLFLELVSLALNHKPKKLTKINKKEKKQKIKESKNQQLQREGISGAEVIDQNCGWLNGKFVIYDYCQ